MAKKADKKTVVKEEPKVEEPKVEEPVVEEPKVEEKLKTVEEECEECDIEIHYHAGNPMKVIRDEKGEIERMDPL